jgi:serine/threonine protein kinase
VATVPPQDAQGDPSQRGLPLGSTIGKYRVVAELGRGGMANVYLAVARGPVGVQKLVVLKALRPDIAAEEQALSMFLDEARLAAQLNHANVVQTYEVGTAGDRHVIVMEYLEGQPLSAVLRKGSAAGNPMPLGIFLCVILNVLEGLHYAHEITSYDGTPLNLVHRDVSPQNVFLTYAGQIKILDFGIAKAATSQNHTAAGVIKGKLSYMAPEQMVASAIDRRADVYSVGCILWAAATGEKLWRNNAGVDLVRKVVSGDVPSPKSVNPNCSDELERIVMKALKADPDQRYASALEFQEDLERYCVAEGYTVHKKEVGAYVSSLFADTQAQLRTAIEKEIKLAVADSSATELDLVPPLMHDAPGEPIEVEPLEDEQAEGGSRAWLAALVLVLVAAGILFARSRLLSTPPAASSAHPPAAVASSPRDSATAASTAAASTISYELRAEPAEARLSLNGVVLDGNPVVKVLPRDKATHVVAASAEGYETVTKEFTAESDGSLTLTLPKSSSKGGKKRPVWVPPPARPATPAAAAPAPASNACEQPFFVDGNGIKKVRPECL